MSHLFLATDLMDPVKLSMKADILAQELNDEFNPDYALQNGSRHDILAHLELCKCSGRPQWYAWRFA